MIPTPAAVKKEVESGPLAAGLAPPWAAVFPTEPEPPGAALPPMPKNPQNPQSVAEWAAYQTRMRWERIRGRFGQLTPDGAAGILAALAAPTRTRDLSVMPRAAFMAAIAPTAVTAAAAGDAVRLKWFELIRLAVTGDLDTVNAGRVELQRLFDAAVKDGLMTAAQRAALQPAGTVPCSRLDELGWTGVTVDLIAAAKAGR